MLLQNAAAETDGGCLNSARRPCRARVESACRGLGNKINGVASGLQRAGGRTIGSPLGPFDAQVEALQPTQGVQPSTLRKDFERPTASPMAEPRFTAPNPDSADPTTVPAASLLVLVVERDPHIRALEAHFLTEAGFEVAFATDGHEALKRVRERSPDIVITEVLVPKLDGLSLCRQLKSDPLTKHIAVLIFSILAASSRAAEAGADAFLMKPLAEQRLLSTVNSLIEKRRKSKG
ncbi:PleD family two-component system response regulator [Roseateles sp. DC23W]|uniref:PleD family two-component system response regulator n=1 Tax=Pelomonas dachongensis TaxID=3299029 RepID=A0ABW7ESG9_9BURK